MNQAPIILIVGLLFALAVGGVVTYLSVAPVKVTPSPVDYDDPAGGTDPEDHTGRPQLTADQKLEIRRLERENERLRAQNEDLEKRRDAIEAELAAMRQRLTKAPAPAKVEASEVLARIAAMRENSMAAFLAPGATAQIIADLKALGEQGTAMVLAMLASEDPDERFLAAKLLEDLADPRAIPDLKKLALAEGEEEKVANMASHAIALMHDPSAAGTLHEIVADSPHQGAQVNALFGLCSINDAQGVELTNAFLQNTENPGGLRHALGSGLLMLSNPSLVPVARTISSQVSGNPRFMGLVIDYYARVGTPAARSELQSLAGDAGLAQEIRDQANAALNQ